MRRMASFLSMTGFAVAFGAVLCARAEPPQHGQVHVAQASAPQPAAAPSSPLFMWHARRTPDGIAMGGRVRRESQLLQQARGLRPGFDIQAWLQPAEAGDDHSDEAQIALLRALAEVGTGYAEIRDHTVRFEAVAATAQAREAAEQFLAHLPPGYQLAVRRIVQPDHAPYVFVARKAANLIELSGFVPDEETRGRLLAEARSVGLPVEVFDRMELRAGAPAGFATAARGALSRLASFQTGLIALNGERVDVLGMVRQPAVPLEQVCKDSLEAMTPGYVCGFVHLDFEPAGARWSTATNPAIPGVATPRPRSPATPAAPNPAETDPRVVDLLFATDREVKQPTAPGGSIEITGERGDRNNLQFGMVRVRVPEDHHIGRLELPADHTWYVWAKETPDPEQHFIIRGLRTMTRAEWEQVIKTLKPTDAIVFVHGFNTGFDAAAFRMAQIIWDLQFKGLPVLFSWPSRGGVYNYQYDRESATWARDHFIALLKILHNEHRIERVHVIAHSMGNFVILDGLAENARSSNPMALAELIMASPDVDRDQFLRYIPQIRRIVRGLTLYASSADRALAASRSLAGGVPRAGDVPADGPIVVEGLETIDITAMGEEIFGLNHDVFAAVRTLIDDIGILVREGRRAPRLSEVRGVPEGASPPKYWRYVQ